MNKKTIIKQLELLVNKQFEQEGSGHDWWHIHRVRKLALILAKEEKADLFITELGALLHDIADFKFHKGDDRVGLKQTAKILRKLGTDDATIDRVCHIVEHISYKGSGVANTMQSLEGKVVQDADRLDAIGAIGIARTFAYGGWTRKQLLYNPDGKITHHQTFQQYKNHPTDSTVHHFYEKLLLLKDRMNTRTAKKMASQRHKFMEQYLKQFFDEWHGRK